MKKTELVGCPKWLMDANTLDEDVSLSATGCLVWHSGSFDGGSFKGGYFLGGYFLGGSFDGGSFEGGSFDGGSFDGGSFEGGSFEGGSFEGGYFRGGSFKGDSFRGGYFLGGSFEGGSFDGGSFEGGSFEGGYFRGGYFRGGYFLGGSFEGGLVCSPGMGVMLKHAKVILTCAICEGYPKTLIDVGGVAWILAGCRLFTLADAEKHWTNRTDRRQTRALLVGIRALAEQMGLKDSAGVISRQ